MTELKESITSYSEWEQAVTKRISVLGRIAGKDFFELHGAGVWCLTPEGYGCAAADWPKLQEFMRRGGNSDIPASEAQPQGVYVVTEETDFVIYPEASASLQWGSKDVELPDICRDGETYDFKTCTEAIIEAHQGAVCGKVAKVYEAPAATWCRSRSLGNIHTWYLPSLAVLEIIGGEIDAINACLKAMGCEPLTPGFHASSTECLPFSIYALFVGDNDDFDDQEDCNIFMRMSNGRMDDYGKNDVCMVRPVSTFQIEDFDLLTFNDVAEKNYSFELREDGIYVTKGDERLKISYEEETLRWGDAKEFAKERSMSLGTVDQRLLVAEVREKVNEALKKADRKCISSGWHWTEKEHALNSMCAYAVNMEFGNADGDHKDFCNVARPVSVF